MKILLGLVIICLLGGCEGGFTPNPNEKVKIASDIRIRAAKKIQNELDLIPFGFGGRMMNQITQLHLIFQCQQPLDIESGRKLLVQATNLFLNEINSNEKVRPYLDNYPFDSRNINIVIIVKNPDGFNVEADKLCFLTIEDGILSFKIDSSDKSRLLTVNTETYEEALQKMAD